MNLVLRYEKILTKPKKFVRQNIVTKKFWLFTNKKLLHSLVLQSVDVTKWCSKKCFDKKSVDARNEGGMERNTNPHIQQHDDTY